MRGDISLLQRIGRPRSFAARYGTALLTVLVATAAALRLLEAHPDIHFLFADVGLSGGYKGRELADEALKRRPYLKVLFTTGYGRDGIIHEGRLDPGVQLITKPFTFGEFSDKIRKVFG